MNTIRPRTKILYTLSLILSLVQGLPAAATEPLKESSGPLTGYESAVGKYSASTEDGFTKKWAGVTLRHIDKFKAMKVALIEKKLPECLGVTTQSACFREWIFKNPPTIGVDVPNYLSQVFSSVQNDKESKLVTAEEASLTSVDNSLYIFEKIDLKKFEIVAMPADGEGDAIAKKIISGQESDGLKVSQAKMSKNIQKLLDNYEQKHLQSANKANKKRFLDAKTRFAAMQKLDFSL